MTTEVTFVTAFIDLQEDRHTRPTSEKYFDFFVPFAECGFKHLVVFISEHFLSQAITRFGSFIKFIPLDLEELDTYKISVGFNHLPDGRHDPVKDTKNYMILMNAKTELLLRVIENPNVEKTTHYAWLDFGASKMFSDPPLRCFSELKNQLEEKQLKTPLMGFPGCWDVNLTKRIDLLNFVAWRYCGTFFIGDRESVKEFCRDARVAFEKVLKETGKLIWEVNVWAMMDMNEEWWYRANHDDSLTQLPDRFFEK